MPKLGKAINIYRQKIPKLTKDKKYSIVTDYLGTPVQMYDEKGQAVWETHLDIYGKVRTFAGRSLSDCPFRYQDSMKIVLKTR